MNHFWETVERRRVVEWAILILAVVSAPYVHGVLGTATLVIAASALIILYNWWRGKGIFRKTS